MVAVVGPARPAPLVLSSPGDLDAAARALAAGAVVGHGFANIYALTTRPDAGTVRAVNALKGRPPGQVGSLTTPPSHLRAAWDLHRLPAGMTAYDVAALLDALLALGPMGFRGPAAGRVPEHLTSYDAGLRTAQLIVPGHACPSNHFLARCLEATGTPYLFITSANRSHHATGAAEEPAHWRADGLRTEFAAGPGFVVLEHADEAEARARYPRHAPTSTSVVALHRVARTPAGGRALVVERHGSLAVEDVRAAVRPLGFEVVLAHGAAQRLPQRVYPDA